MTASTKKSAVASDNEARSVQGPGVFGTLSQSSTTTPGSGQLLKMTAWKGKYVMVWAETADVAVLFMSTQADGSAPVPSSPTNFNLAATANDAASPSLILPDKIIAGMPPTPMMVPNADGDVYLAHAGIAATGTIKVKRG